MGLIEKKDKINIIFIIIALILALLIHNLNLPTSVTHVGNAVLTSAGKSAIGVLIFALLLWMTEAIPFHITGLLAVFFMAILKIETFKEVVKAGFGNHIFIFFIGVLILSSFISRSGFGKRISVFLLSKTGNNTRVIILGFLIIGAMLSMWVTDMAVAAILLPLGKGILEEEGVKPLKSNFGRALMIACAWGPIIGGIGTPAGCGPNPLSIGFLKEMANVDVIFLKWMMFGFPAAITLIIPAWLILITCYPPEMKHLNKLKDKLRNEYKELSPMKREEKITVVVFLLTVFFWLSASIFEKILKISIPISMSVLFTSALFFLPGMSKISWREIEKDMSWGSIILVVSGLSLGMMLYKSGAAEWLSVVLLGKITALGTFSQIFIIILIVSLLKVAFSSNTVTATIVIPLIIALSKSLGLDALGITMPAALTSSLAFILVTSTPTNVIPYSAGYFSISDMAKVGIVMTIVSSLFVAVVMYIIGGMVHVY